jgi:N-acetylmuramoyl-L-alanine amidase/Putative peptidoglycan binding domain
MVAGRARLPGPPDPRSSLRLSRRALIALVSGLTVGGGMTRRSSAGSGALAGQADDAAIERAAALVADRYPAPVQPPIYTCAAWGARKPSAPVTELRRRPTKIFIHHTATANRTDVGPADLGVLARAIQTFHMRNGWIDSGHHFLVNRGGLIAEGRHRSLETLRVGRSFIEGAQCADYNDSSIGIENQGTYGKVNPPAALLVSLRALCAYACLQYQLAPEHLYGHRDFGDTECPGDRLYALLPQLRAQVAVLLGKAMDATQAALTWPLLRLADRGPAVLAAQHLLRAADVPGVPADGVFGQSTADGVVEFQRRHGGEQTGMIGGGSWPRLVAPVRPGQGGEVDAALTALLSRSGARRFDLPVTANQETWQRLLAQAT